MNHIKLLYDFLVHEMLVLTSIKLDPFVQDFKNHVLNERLVLSDIDAIEKIRSGLLKDNTPTGDLHFGAGSRYSPAERTISQVTFTSSVKPAYGRLLFRLARHYKPSQIIELGTATGISTMYLSCGNPEARVTTVEGNRNLLNVAESNFRLMGLKNITAINDTFDNVLPQLMENLTPDSLVFTDGNHTRKATFHYFSTFIETKKNLILIFDDINWSTGMHSAWNEIRKKAPGGTIIDLFFMGIYFCNWSLPLQYFTLNY